MASNWPILSLLIWLPIFGGLAVIAAGDQRPALARMLALFVSGLTFILSIFLFTAFDTAFAMTSGLAAKGGVRRLRAIGSTSDWYAVSFECSSRFSAAIPLHSLLMEPG